MLRLLVEIFTIGLQDYIMTSLVCSLYRIKEPYSRSFKIALFQQIVAFVVVNFVFSATPAHRVISGTIVFIIVGYFFFDGSLVYKIFAAVSEYGMFFFIDLLIQYLFFPSLMEVLSALPQMDMFLLGRNFATSFFFLIYVLLELYKKRKDGKHLTWIMGLSVVFAAIQMIIFDLAGKANSNGLVENGILLTAIFAMSLMGGYLIVMELFQQTLRQQIKQSELEQMAMERQYQFEYYKKAFFQREQIRDMRHDMRNQLQTVRYLMMSTDEKDKERGKRMLDELCEKV